MRHFKHATLLAVREWEREGMGITNWDGNKTRLNLGLGMGMGMRLSRWDWEGIGLKNTFPLIYSSQSQTFV